MLDALEIGYAIKDARSKLGMTQAQLAETAGISKRCLWSLELGQNPGVQLDKLLAVLKALGLDLSIVAGESQGIPRVTVVIGNALVDAYLPGQGRSALFMGSSPGGPDYTRARRCRCRHLAE